MDTALYDNRKNLHVVKTLSWGTDDDGHQFATAIVWDGKRGDYFLRYIKAPQGGERVDTLEELDTWTWHGVHGNIRAVVERHRGA